MLISLLSRTVEDASLRVVAPLNVSRVCLCAASDAGRCVGKSSSAVREKHKHGQAIVKSVLGGKKKKKSLFDADVWDAAKLLGSKGIKKKTKNQEKCLHFRKKKSVTEGRLALSLGGKH